MEQFTKVTFAMIKPDAIIARNSGKIIDIIEQNGFEIIRMQKVILAPDLAEEFYEVHKDRPFYKELVDFVTSGPVIVMALYKDNAITSWRDLIGATDPAKAAEGTIRNTFGTSVGNNAVHGSDSSETALSELGLFFPELFEDDRVDNESSDEEDDCCDEDEDCDNSCENTDV